jgi:hypothetical protein
VAIHVTPAEATRLPQKNGEHASGKGKPDAKLELQIYEVQNEMRNLLADAMGVSEFAYAFLA